MSCELSPALGTFLPKTRKSEKCLVFANARQLAVRLGGPLQPILQEIVKKRNHVPPELCRNFLPVSPDAPCVARPASAPAASAPLGPRPAVFDTSVNTCETLCQCPLLTTKREVRSLTTERTTTPRKGRERKEREERVCEE